MSRAELGIDAGPLDEVEVVPVADDYWHSLLVMRFRDARITLQVQRRDVGRIALVLAEAERIEDARQAAEDAASEAEA